MNFDQARILYDKGRELVIKLYIWHFIIQYYKAEPEGRDGAF